MKRKTEEEAPASFPSEAYHYGLRSCSCCDLSCHAAAAGCNLKPYKNMVCHRCTKYGHPEAAYYSKTIDKPGDRRNFENLGRYCEDTRKRERCKEVANRYSSEPKYLPVETLSSRSRELNGCRLSASQTKVKVKSLGAWIITQQLLRRKNLEEP